MFFLSGRYLQVRKISNFNKWRMICLLVCKEMSIKDAVCYRRKQLTLTLLEHIFHEYLFSRHVTRVEENNTIYLKFSITNQL